MKHLSLILSVLFFTAFQGMAQSDAAKTETFKVYGNCGMCKKTIEKAAKSVDGVKKATWDEESKMLTVKFNESEASLDVIKKSIADSGYDSDTHRASDEVYNNLHGCCQYDRPVPLKTKVKAQKITMKAEDRVTANFTVYGNCGMCKSRIEGALKDAAGLTSADWNKETKVLTVNYDPAETNIDDIKKRIAEAGHDTDKFQAKDEVYNALPGCCQYERPKG